jgi:hypothetical protein
MWEKIEGGWELSLPVTVVGVDALRRMAIDSDTDPPTLDETVRAVVRMGAAMLRREYFCADDRSALADLLEWAAGLREVPHG